ncbi:MAG: Asp-tRNA(Asn)/Glu-tRNA(Gln) amidotransferase GatCAB subunit B, partial [Thermoanaerobaculia bacterium]
RGTVPELPVARSERYQRDLGIPAGDADVLTMTRELAEFFEATATESGNAKAAANWVRNDVLRVNYGRVTPSTLGMLIKLIDTGAIGGKAAKEVFEEMSESGERPDAIVQRKGLAQVSDPSVIRVAAQKILDRNSAQVEEYRAGKEKVFGFLVGQLMKDMRGKANAEVANRVLRELLGSG